MVLGLILSSIVVFQLLFIAFFLFISKKGKRISNALLGTFFLLLGINVLDMVLVSQGLEQYYRAIALFDDGFILACGPLIYLYGQSIMYKDFQFDRKAVLHFMPYLFVTFFLVIVQNTLGLDQQKAFLEDIQSFELPLYVNILAGLFFLHAGIYLHFARKAYRDWIQQLTAKTSSLDDPGIHWFRFILNSIVIFGCIAILHALLPFSILKPYLPITLTLFIGFLFYFINAVFFKALQEPAVFLEQARKPKYAESSLEDQELELLKSKLLAFIQAEKPYLQADLSLEYLATALDMHSKKLSELINRAFGKNFYNFINDFRIEEAKALLLDTNDPNKTVLEILYQVGFNSKSSFNTLFKKATGKTPSQFRKEIRSSS